MFLLVDVELETGLVSLTLASLAHLMASREAGVDDGDTDLVRLEFDSPKVDGGRPFECYLIYTENFASEEQVDGGLVPRANSPQHANMRLLHLCSVPVLAPCSYTVCDVPVPPNRKYAFCVEAPVLIAHSSPSIQTNPVCLSSQFSLLHVLA